MQPLQLGGYSLMQRLGSGGVGAVYRALAPTGEIVAVKVLNAATKDDNEARRRFRREFEVARKLVHPHLVRYLDFGTDGGQPYIAMEYVEGVSLWDHVRRQGPMPEAAVARVAQQIGSALDAAHGKNVMHRDVKPNNVLLTPAGDAKLADFGLVKDLESAGNFTADQAILGTPYFMAPEQFFNARTVDRRADIYGLAATLLFAVTGRVPFKFPGAGLLEKKLTGQFHPPGQVLPNSSPELLGAIALALDPEPTRRPQTAAALARGLGGASEQGTRGTSRHTLPRGIERRSSKRRKCGFEGHHPAAGDQCEYPAQITDISLEGLCMIAARQLAPKSVWTLSFCFGDGSDNWDYQVRVVNVGAWASQQWRHGCRFLVPIDRAELSALVNENKENVWVRISAAA
jgi:serine/threonine protein kinase